MAGIPVAAASIMTIPKPSLLLGKQMKSLAAIYFSIFTVNPTYLQRLAQSPNLLIILGQIFSSSGPTTNQNKFGRVLAVEMKASVKSNRPLSSVSLPANNKTCESSGIERLVLTWSRRSCEKLNLDYKLIYRNTLTTYSPDSNGNSNGKTGSDVERILAFNQLGIEDPGLYLNSWDKLVSHALDCEKEINS